ncbi:MAG: NAD-dependent epimerase/dehydratase family protein [Saprospiraceae bacterium]|nr:NAD-dependent epimerase/dehydratase family protein [Saprospiraceae bacterium]
MKKIFMTGITGLLGTNLANTLLENGYVVSAIVRNPRKYKGTRGENLHLIQMDLSGDYDTYLLHSDTVIHLAAETATNLIGCDTYKHVNTDATIRLYKKAKQQGVQQFIFISTAATIGHGNLDLLGKESHKMKKPFSQLCYAQSKWKAEQFLIERKSEMDIKILNPTFIIGPNDNKPSSGKIIRLALGRKIVFCPPGGKNFVPVRDVVQGIMQAFKYGVAGEHYLIAGENLTYSEFYRRLGHLTKEKQLLIPLPKLFLLAAGIIGELFRLCKVKTSISYINMKVLCEKNYYNNQKSKSELQLTYSSLDQAIAQAVAFFRRKNGKSFPK